MAMAQSDIGESLEEKRAKRDHADRLARELMKPDIQDLTLETRWTVQVFWRRRMKLHGGFNEFGYVGPRTRVLR